MISLNKHLEEASKTNIYLKLVLQHEENRLVRVATEFTKAIGITGNQTKISVEAKSAIKKKHKDAYEEKIQHGYVNRIQ